MSGTMHDPERKEDEDETDWPIEGEVGDPMTEEEAEASDAAWWALHLPPATDEEVAEATRQLEVGERHRQMVVEVLRRRRRQAQGVQS